MKYKFRLSYKENHKLIPIELEKLNILKELDVNEIKTIDKFTTLFENEKDLLNYLKQHELIPQKIEKLYITFDVKKEKLTLQQLYAYNKTIFYKNNIDKLKYSYIYELIMRRNIEDGEFINKIVEHYKRKYVRKNFTTLESLSRIVREYGISTLSPSSKEIYEEKLEKLLKFVFYKENGKKNYKNIRDFICYIHGEEPIVVKKDKEIKKEFKKIKKDVDTSYIEYENISMNEWTKTNKIISMNPETFEPYQDGNDFFAPLSSEEIEESLNDYARSLTLKRDNGEYE